MSYKDLKVGGDSSMYFKLKEGANTIRIVSEAIPVWTSFNRTEKTAKKYLSEEIARNDADAKPRYALWVIDREDGKFKMAELGVSIMKQIQVLALDSAYGFEEIPAYDMKITRSGSGMQTKYTVLPQPASALTPDEQAHVVSLEKVHDFMACQPGVVTTSESVPF